MGGGFIFYEKNLFINRNRSYTAKIHHFNVTEMLHILQKWTTRKTLIFTLFLCQKANIGPTLGIQYSHKIASFICVWIIQFLLISQYEHDAPSKTVQGLPCHHIHYQTQWALDECTPECPQLNQVLNGTQMTTYRCKILVTESIQIRCQLQV